MKAQDAAVPEDLQLTPALTQAAPGTELPLTLMYQTAPSHHQFKMQQLANIALFLTERAHDPTPGHQLFQIF